MILELSNLIVDTSKVFCVFKLTNTELKIIGDGNDFYYNCKNIKERDDVYNKILECKKSDGRKKVYKAIK